MICFNDSSIRCTWIQPPRTIKILIESLWITDKAAFSGIVDHFERQIRAYENSFKLAIQTNIVGMKQQQLIAIIGYVVGYLCYDDEYGWVVTFRVGYCIAIVTGVSAVFLPQSSFYMVRKGQALEDVLENHLIFYSL